jgi:hypothetical protein
MEVEHLELARAYFAFHSLQSGLDNVLLPLLFPHTFQDCTGRIRNPLDGKSSSSPEFFWPLRQTVYASPPFPAQGGFWGDFNNDGLLDLFVVNGLDGLVTNAFLYRNNGDGTFTQIGCPRRCPV